MDDIYRCSVVTKPKGTLFRHIPRGVLFLLGEISMKKKQVIDSSGNILTPSLFGRKCFCNGKQPGAECCCDECDYFLLCYPEYYFMVKFDTFKYSFKKFKAKVFKSKKK